MRKNIPVCSHADLEALASSISIKVDTNATENVMNKIKKTTESCYTTF